MRRWWVLCGMLVLAGCASVGQPVTPPPRETAVSYREVLPPGQVRYQLALGEVAVQPVIEANPAPIYPPELIAQALPPMEFTAQVIVNAQGTVDDVRVAGASGEPAARFAAAIQQSVRQWRFSPLTITHWAADAEGNQHQVGSESKPFSQSYVFHFECRDGRPVVSSVAAHP